MGRVVHFEIHAGDCDRAERFYRDVFGWRIDRWEGAAIDYRLITTGDPAAPGINGAITERTGPGPDDDTPVSGFACTVEVDDVDAVAERAAAAGGRRVGEAREIEGVGRVAQFRDPEGNLVGALQPARVAAEAPLAVGERVVLEAEAVGRAARHGVVTEVVRADPPRYRVRWDDGHESLYTPSAGALRRERDVAAAR
jgi:predicted enzyme related to lactoylglutathione lyase